MKRILIILIFLNLLVIHTSWAIVIKASQTMHTTVASGTNWTTPTNVYLSDDARAIYNNTAQNQLIMTGFGFTIPTYAIIDSIAINVEGNGTSGTTAQRIISEKLDSVTTVKGSSFTDTLNQTNDNNQIRIKALSGAGWNWGTLTPAKANMSGFGCIINDNDATAAALNLDQVQMTIYYHYTLGNRRQRIGNMLRGD
jgi:hypothetical protein